MKKINKRVNYEILAKLFESWWLRQLDDYFDIALDHSISVDLLKRAHCSNQAEFEDKFLKHWINLDSVTVEEILRVLTKHHFFSTRNSLTFQVSHTYKIRFEGLFLLLAQVERLQLFPLKDREELKEMYKQPVKQCIWCGQTNHDPNGDPFNGSRIACHIKDCPEIKGNTESNPSGHAERGCCSGHWKMFANRIKQQVNRDAGSTDEAWRFLESACELLLQHNQDELKFCLQYVDRDTGNLIVGIRPDSILSPAEGRAEIMQRIESKSE